LCLKRCAAVDVSREVGAALKTAYENDRATKRGRYSELPSRALLKYFSSLSLEICGNILDTEKFVFNLLPGKMIFNIYVLSSLVASRVIGYTNTTLVVFKNIYWPI